MYAEALKRLMSALSSTSAAPCIGAVVFLKWFANRQSKFESRINWLEFVNESKNNKKDLARYLHDTFFEIESDKSREFVNLFSWINFHDLTTSRESDRNYYLREIITTIDVAEIDEKAMLSELFVHVESNSVETPISIARLLAELVKCRDGEHILDPVCGSASLLVSCASPDSKVTGFERNRSLWFFAKLNLLLSGFSSIGIENTDCFSSRIALTGKCDVIVGNPPWGMRLEAWDGDIELMQGAPFNQNPKSFLDYAFVLEMIHRMHPSTGRVAVLVSNGMLTRPGPDAQVRRQLIEDNLLDTVISLPEKTFVSTSIGSAILLFKASRPTSEILFVDARPFATQARGQNSLSDSAVREISSLILERKDLPGRSRSVPVAEVADQDFTIAVPRYISKSSTRSQIDVQLLSNRKKELQNEVQWLSDRIDTLLLELRKMTKTPRE
jgi:type I restriction-modification system DNA methylase subunit